MAILIRKKQIPFTRKDDELIIQMRKANKSFREIAETLNRPQSTIVARVYRVLTKIDSLEEVNY